MNKMVKKLRQNKKVRELFHAGLAYLIARYTYREIAAELVSIGQESFSSPIAVDHTAVLRWHNKGRTPYSDAIIYAVIICTTAAIIRDEADKRLLRALKERIDKMREFRPSLEGVFDYLKSRGESDDYIAESASKIFSKSIKRQKIAYWRKGTHEPRGQKAADFLRKQPPLLEKMADYKALVDSVTTEVPNEAETLIRARFAKETGLSERVQEALKPLFARNVDFMISDNDLKKRWKEIVEDYRAR